MKSAFKRLTHRISRRGAFLLFLAVLDVVYSFSLFFPDAASVGTPQYVYLRSIAPMAFWASMWGLVGLTCFIYAFRRWDAPGFAAGMFLKVIWAAVFTLGWMSGGLDRGYLLGVVWGTFAFVVGLISTWPEPEERERWTHQ